MGVIARPDILYLQPAVPTNVVWGYNQKAEEQLDVCIDEMLCALLAPPEATFRHPELREDLELDLLVDKAFNPAFCPEFVKRVIATASTDKAIIENRQQTLEYLFQRPDDRTSVEKIALSLNGLVKLLVDIDKQKKLSKINPNVQQYSGGLLAAEVTLLSGYVDVVHQLASLPDPSNALQQLAQFGKTIEQSDAFKELETYSIAFRNRHVLTLEVILDAVGGITGVQVTGVQASGSFSRYGLMLNRGGERVLGRFGIDPYTLVAEAIDKIVAKNVQQISEATFLLGPLDMYLSCLRFYEEMAKRDVPLMLPEIKEAEHRDAHIPGVRNPLLLYQKGEKRIMSGADIVSNDILYDERTRLQMITGPNSGGKTVFTRATGIDVVLAQNGMRIPAEANGTGCYLSVVDGLYTLFISRETTDSAAGQLEYQGRQILRVLQQLTPHSLVLFDEIGRGTSEAEGTEFCFDNIVYPLAVSKEGSLGSAAYFSTHIHQLAERVDGIPGVQNLQAEIVTGADSQLAPTYRIIPGRAGQSHARLVEERVGLGREGVDALLRGRRERASS